MTGTTGNTHEDTFSVTFKGLVVLISTITIPAIIQLVKNKAKSITFPNSFFLRRLNRHLHQYKINIPIKKVWHYPLTWKFLQIAVRDLMYAGCLV